MDHNTEFGAGAPLLKPQCRRVKSKLERVIEHAPWISTCDDRVDVFKADVCSMHVDLGILGDFLVPQKKRKLNQRVFLQVSNISQWKPYSCIQLKGKMGWQMRLLRNTT